MNRSILSEMLDCSCMLSFHRHGHDNSKIVNHELIINVNHVNSNKKFAGKKMLAFWDYLLEKLLFR